MVRSLVQGFSPHLSGKHRQYFVCSRFQPAIKWQQSENLEIFLFVRNFATLLILALLLCLIPVSVSDEAAVRRSRPAVVPFAAMELQYAVCGVLPCVHALLAIQNWCLSTTCGLSVLQGLKPRVDEAAALCLGHWLPVVRYRSLPVDS